MVQATGLPITTHTEVEQSIGLAQCELFQEEGVDMNRVCALHHSPAGPQPGFGFSLGF